MQNRNFPDSKYQLFGYNWAWGKYIFMPDINFANSINILNIGKM